MNQRSTIKHDAGFTLIELLVAMLIGTLVVGVSLSMFQHSARTRGIVVSTSELQEEAFFVSHVLSQQLAQIGHRGIDESLVGGRGLPFRELDVAFPEVTGSWEAGQYLAMTSNTVSMRFYGASNSSGTPDNSIYDCLGTPVGSNELRESTFTVNSGQLYCTVGAISAVLAGSTDGFRVDNIIPMIGVDSNGDGVPDQRIAGKDATIDDFNKAKHVELRLLLGTKDNLPAVERSFLFDGTEITSTENRQWTEVSVSVVIRN